MAFPMNLQHWLLSLILALIIAGLAYKAKALSASGMLAAALVGSATLAGGGWLAALLLMVFFISSSALSRVGGRRKRTVVATFAKGKRRDYGQVLANGGLTAFCAIMYGLSGEGLWLACIIGALAAANADTWATELGVLSDCQPRLITSRELVEVGTSGGVTAIGTLASAAGAGMIGLIAALFSGEWSMTLSALVGGTFGALLDSLLGATIQAMYWCPLCRRATEHYPRHTCGAETSRIRGLPWMNNDVVNFFATAIGSLLAAIIWSVIRC